MSVSIIVKNYIILLVMILCGTIAGAQIRKDSLPITSRAFNRFEVAENFIPLHNGIQLSALIVRHESDSLPGPVILVVNCYPSDYTDAGSVKGVLRKGYVGVLVYSRGKEKSTGVFEPFEHEAQDMYEIIDWVSKQPWCNGKIGMFGGSYLGFTQWAALKKLHPALKTIVPQVAAAPGIDYPIHNGVFMPYMLRWINYTTNAKLNDGKVFDNYKYWHTVYNQYYKKGIAFNRLDSLDKSPDSIFQRWLQHPGYDYYWANMIPSTPAEYAAINIPILTITGYFDDEQLGALYYYKMHHAYGNEDALKNHYLLIGPWDHFGAQGYPSKKIGTYKVDSLAVISVMKLVMDWFDYTLKGKSKPDMLENRVNYFVMGSSWKHAASLEKMNQDSLQFFLGNRSSQYYELTQTGLKKSQPLILEYNPLDISDSITVG